MAKLSAELIEEAFAIMDTDGDGKIDKQTTLFGIRALGKVLSVEQAKSIEDKIKGDVDVKLFQELLGTKGLKTYDEFDEGMRSAFKALDSENNGKLAEHELRHILRNLGDARVPGDEVDLLFTEVHTDPSGGVDYEEFCDMLTTGYPPDAGL